jgi:hypothetical protein
MEADAHRGFGWDRIILHVKARLWRSARRAGDGACGEEVDIWECLPERKGGSAPCMVRSSCRAW